MGADAARPHYRAAVPLLRRRRTRYSVCFSLAALIQAPPLLCSLFSRVMRRGFLVLVFTRDASWARHDFGCAHLLILPLLGASLRARAARSDVLQASRAASKPSYRKRKSDVKRANSGTDMPGVRPVLLWVFLILGARAERKNGGVLLTG